MFDLANQEHWVVKMVEVEESVPHESRNQISVDGKCYIVLLFFDSGAFSGYALHLVPLPGAVCLTW